MKKPQVVHLAVVLAVASGMLLLCAPQSRAQQAEPKFGSDNIEVLAHIPLGAPLSVADIDMEQELDRPFVYVARMFDEAGFDVIDIGDPESAKVIYSWRIENVELHRGTGAMDPKTFKLDGRYYLVQSMQFNAGGADHDLGAVVFDVTGLPDPKKVKEIGRIREPETPRGFHNIFIYKHSDGRVLLFSTVSGPFANVYDLGIFVRDGPEHARVARIPIPDSPEMAARQAANPDRSVRAYHDMYAGYDPATGQDKFYGGGVGGYYIYDISRLDEPKLLTSITGVAGVRRGHTFTPTPDGRYAVGETEYQYAPLRIFDMKPGLDGEVATIRQPIAAWTANWKNLTHNHEVRWPYVFVSGYEDGLQIFNMQDPTNPFTVGYYDTFQGKHKTGMCRSRICNGAFGVDVRNADGLIVLSDMASGFWAFSMEGFEGWDGHGWGMPNISSAQDWDNGPEGKERSVTLRDGKASVGSQ
ncbi:MAG: hypothetical protein Q8W48_07880 [Candidatus Palauibacterales bacterium]|nr:hypothetical protein [Candidatus Palauibacterales bacterium]